MSKIALPKLYQIPFKPISTRICRTKSQNTSDSYHSPTKKSILKQPSDFSMSSFFKKKGSSRKKVTINPKVEVKEVEVITYFSYSDQKHSQSGCGKCSIF